MMRQIIDISQSLTIGIPVWPGDTEFQTTWMARMEDGSPYNLGSVTMSLHTGTHTDAPLHFARDGASITEIDLSVYIGESRVIDMVDAKSIEAQALQSIAPKLPERLLFKTRLSPTRRFDPEYAYIAPEAARLLANSGVRLVGIDTPSVDSSRYDAMETHKILATAGIAIVENLNLVDAAPGVYELIALPLKFAGMDGSPVRAVLRSLP